MLLDDLLEAGIVQLRELSQVMNLRNYVAQVLLQKHEVLFGMHVGLSAMRLIRALLVGAGHHLGDLALCHADTLDDLITLDLLE